MKISLTVILAMWLSFIYISIVESNSYNSSSENDSNKGKEEVDQIKLDSNSFVKKWIYFKKKFNKSYNTLEEELLRYTIYVRNIEKIRIMNNNYKATNEPYLCDINEFGDMTITEYRKILLPAESIKTLKYYNQTIRNPLLPKILANKKTVIPDSFDWRDLGAVGPVKNQKKCASCWAFSAAAAIEAQVFKFTKKPVSLSEQQMMDCSTDYGNRGCNKGAMNLAFKYVRDNGGLVAEELYPYEAQLKSCRTDNKTIVAACSGFEIINKGDEEMIKRIVATVGPVCVNIEATKENFMFYKKGIFMDSKCTDNKLNHGMTIVGYGSEKIGDKDVEYWIVRNSFGPNWGEGGYIRMARNSNNMCGIATYASYPIVKSKDVTQVLHAKKRNYRNYYF